MIETYQLVNSKIKAVQLLNDSESMADVKEFLGKRFVNFQQDSANRIHVFYKVGSHNAKAFATQGDYIIKREDGELASILPATLNKTYKRVWD